MFLFFVFPLWKYKNISVGCENFKLNFPLSRVGATIFIRFHEFTRQTSAISLASDKFMPYLYEYITKH